MSTRSFLERCSHFKSVRRASALPLEVRYCYHRKEPKILVSVSGKLFFSQAVFNISSRPVDMTLVAFFFSYVYHLLVKFGLVGAFKCKE